MAFSFDNVGAVAAKPTTKKAAKKAEFEIEGIELAAKLNALFGTIKTLKDTHYEEIKDGAIADKFVSLGVALGKQPENFRANDGKNASASCEYKAKAHPLTDDEQALLLRHGIALVERVVTEETYIINPAYFSDVEVLKKVQKALAGVKGLPEDFIQKQNKVSKWFVSDAGRDSIFTKPKAVCRALLTVVGTLSLKPKLEKTNIAEIITEVSGLLAETAEKTEADKAEKKAAKAA